MSSASPQFGITLSLAEMEALIRRIVKDAVHEEFARLLEQVPAISGQPAIPAAVGQARGCRKVLHGVAAPRWIFSGYDEDLADNHVGRITGVTGKTRMQTATVQAEVPTQLVTQMDVLIEQGWFRSKDELIIDALRRLIETHRPELMEEHIRQDVEWGLHGQE